ncbi:MAG: hypothetical protein KIH01_03935 [Candidatus Freyarchaeota archaeon]|nr:hypothetical protein [Candidatus Jordarchaeia archaeon]
MLEAAMRVLEHYTRLIKEEGESPRLVDLYPKAIDALGIIMNAASSMRKSGDYRLCSPLLLLCASFLELEGVHVRAAALYIGAGDCLFAEGHLKEALECFLKGYQRATLTPSRAGKIFASIALLMAAFTALKLEGPPLFKNTIKLARDSVDKKTWGSIRRTKYYVLLRSLYQLTGPSLHKNAPLTLQVLEELSNLAVGCALKEWLQNLNANR